MKERVNEHERELRYYERKPHEYAERFGEGEGKTDQRLETKTVLEEHAESPKSSEEESEWGFWKTYEAADAKRVLEWKKGILQKKQLGNQKMLPWDRSSYLEKEFELNQRRRLKQNRRYIREKEKRERQESHPLNMEEVSSVHPQVERPRDRRKEGRRQRGYEDLQNPERRDSSRVKDFGIQSKVNPVQTQRIWAQVGKSMDGEFTVRTGEEGKVQYGFSKKNLDKGKRERVQEEIEEREEQRLDPDVNASRKEERNQEITRKAKRRKYLREKQESRQKRELVWTPFGKRMRVHGWMQGHLP
jgi:hypothetical protein